MGRAKRGVRIGQAFLVRQRSSPRDPQSTESSPADGDRVGGGGLIQTERLGYARGDSVRPLCGVIKTLGSHRRDIA